MPRRGVLFDAEEGGPFQCRPGVHSNADPGVPKNADGGSLSLPVYRSSARPSGSSVRCPPRMLSSAGASSGMRSGPGTNNACREITSIQRASSGAKPRVRYRYDL